MFREFDTRTRELLLRYFRVVKGMTWEEAERTVQEMERWMRSH